MATIINAYDLSSGDTLSSEVATPNNVRIQFEVTGATSASQVVLATLQVNDGSAYVNLVGSNDKATVYPITGNVKFSRNFYGVNSASLKVKIEPQGTCDGSLTVTTYET